MAATHRISELRICYMVVAPPNSSCKHWPNLQVDTNKRVETKQEREREIPKHSKQKQHEYVNVYMGMFSPHILIYM